MEKRIILKNERTYNSDDVKLASKENIKERFLLFFTIYSAFLILLGGVFIILPNNKTNVLTFMVAGIICFVMAAISLFFYFFIILRIKRTNYKDVEYKYTFYEDELVIAVNSEELNQHQVIKYRDILKCIKGKNYTFIYFNKTQAYFFLNSDLNEEVYRILKKNIKKFKD
ncbi:MAG: hypothetical protein K6F81_05970 [Acholeplasmatales bacterium]|nr:hypothetical protein [Acholeplasmatales bacterium]